MRKAGPEVLKEILPKETMKRPARASSRLKPGQVSLERAMSKLGLASRTQARELILAGRVEVNGAVRKDPGFALRPETARIRIDGETQARARWKAFLLHKPNGVVTTRQDERGRPTVFSLLKDAERELTLHSVGRLDLATTGLLILTNDSRLSSWLTDPTNQVPRVYVVTVRGQINDEDCRKLETGIMIDGETHRAEKALLRKASKKESHLTLTLTEGKNREIRRLFEALGCEVTRLKRVTYGSLELGDLPSGEYRELPREEVQAAFPEAPLSPLS